MKKVIDQSKKAKEQFQSPILPLLRRDEKISKNSLKSRLNIDERTIRRMISDVSMHYAVIAHSKDRGYRLAKPIDTLDYPDLEMEMNEVKMTINELQSRVKHLKAKMKPLIAYLKVAERVRDERMTEVRRSLAEMGDIVTEIKQEIIRELEKQWLK